ncbi:MAG: chloride channel protein [Bacteroidia bacterium]|nr:chloride channel protein [Bacteroidia bacterium]
MTTQHYHHPSLESKLKEACESIRNHEKIGAEEYATRLLPRPHGDHMDMYMEGFHHEYQLQLDSVNTELQFKSICQQVSEQEKKAQKQKQDLRNKLSEAKQKQVDLDEELKKTPVPPNAKGQRKARIASFIVCLFEGIFSIPVFESWGMNFLVSTILGFLLAGVLAAFAEIFPRILAIGKTVWQRRLIVLSLFIVTLTLFTFLAFIRADFLNSGDAKQLGLHYSPWPFVCISEFLLITAVALCYFFHLTLEQRNAIQKHQVLKTEIEAIQKEISEFEEAVRSVDEDTRVLKNQCGSMLVFGSMMEEMVINHALGSYAMFKKTNLMHREDNHKPDCFDEPYPFSFSTNFNSIKKLQHENNN